MNKLGFLSLEYIVGDQTYWLESDFTAPLYLFHFRVIPLSMFAGWDLKPNHIILEADYSEMTRYNDNGKTLYLFAPNQDADAVDIGIDVASFPQLRWNDAFDALVAAKVPLVDLQGFWHEQLVRASPTAPNWVKQGLNYHVTAYLPDGPDPLFAVWGEDYKLPENPNAVTIRCEDEEAFFERLHWFRVHAVRFSRGKNEYYLV